MTEVSKQKGILRSKEEQDNRVREWEEGLPSLADLICLSQCLISPQLASAFSITSSPSSPPRSVTDVALASHTAFFSLPSTSPAYPDLVGSSHIPAVNPYPQSEEGDDACHDPQLNAGDSTCLGGESPHVNLYPQRHEGDCSINVGLVSERIHDRQAQSKERYLTDFTPLDAKDRRNDGEVSVREWRGHSQPALAGHFRTHDAEISARKDHGSSAPSDGYSGGVLKAPERVEDGMGEGDPIVQANAAPSILDSSDVARQLDDGEAEEAESAPSPPENPNEETTARTLKRPRLVWNPELHKRFVDAVSHLGVKTAVPKTIMQLMNVEGLTRENVASHLQKYRLYLKRMQGLSNEGPTSSDHLFASTPIPANLAMSGRFHAGIPAHLQDFTQVPFTPSHNPISIGSGHVAGIMSSPSSPMDHYSFNFFTRPPNRFVQGDPKDVQVSRHKHSAPLQHVPKK